MTHDDLEVRASPMFPVADLDRALEHYAALGFLVSRWSEDYGFAAWRGLELHLVVQPGHDPASLFLHVPDADEVFALWSAAGVGRTTAPESEPWGVREGDHFDGDGDRLRFGSPLASGG